MDTTSIITKTGTCWCPSASTLIGQHIRVGSLPAASDESTTVSVITDVDHTHTTTGSRCWLVLDGWHRTPLVSSPRCDELEITVTDEPTTLGARIRKPLLREGPLTLADVYQIVSDYAARYQLAGDAIPHLPGGSSKIRRAFIPKAPARPTVMRSYYTQGRIRRVPATGRWAADQGFAGTLRPLGEYDTPAEAEAALRGGILQAWDRLEAWLTAHVAGSWDLCREYEVTITTVDRLSAKDAADLIEVEPSTWTSYVSRGQAPEPTGTDAAGRPYWDRIVVLDWLQHGRPGQGARTDLLCSQVGCTAPATLVAGGLPWCCVEHIPADMPRPV